MRYLTDLYYNDLRSAALSRTRYRADNMNLTDRAQGWPAVNVMTEYAQTMFAKLPIVYHLEVECSATVAADR